MTSRVHAIFWKGTPFSHHFSRIKAVSICCYLSMKSYLRYEPKKTFGVIASPQCNVIYDCSGHLALTASLDEISIWNLRQATQIGSMKVLEPSYPYALAGDVTILLCGQDKCTVAAGYSGGEVRLFNYLTKECIATLRGHRSAVTSLAYEPQGSLLVSGGADSDIFLWDLVTLTGVCKLRGHKDAVTGVAFMQRSVGQPLIVSVSKDTLMKVWDVVTQHCIQTIVGHRCELWSLAVYHQGRVADLTPLVDTLVMTSPLVNHVLLSHIIPPPLPSHLSFLVVLHSLSVSRWCGWCWKRGGYSSGDRGFR